MFHIWEFFHLLQMLEQFLLGAQTQFVLDLSLILDNKADRLSLLDLNR